MTKLIERPFDPKTGYPIAPHRFFECLRCDDIIPSIPSKSADCSCENIQIDVDAGRVVVKDHSQMRLLEEPGHPFLNALSAVVTTLGPIGDVLAKLTRPSRFQR